MPNRLAKILIKVGKSSDISFRNVKAFRALSLIELDELSAKYPEAKAVVIEHITENETEGIKDFIRRFTQDKPEHKVYFYVKDNDPVTCGVADELEYNIYLSLDSLHIALYQLQQIDAFINLGLIKKAANKEIAILDKAESTAKITEIPSSERADKAVEAADKKGTPKQLQKPTVVKPSAPEDTLKVVEKAKSEGAKPKETLKESSKESFKESSRESQTPQQKVESTPILAQTPETPVVKTEVDTKAKIAKDATSEVEIEALRGSNDGLQAEIVRLKADIDGLNNKLTQAIQAKNSLEEALNTTTLTVQTLSEQNANLQSTINNQNQKLTSITSSGESKVTELTSEVEKLQASLSDTTDKLNTKIKNLTLEISSRLKIMRLLSIAVSEIRRAEDSLKEKNDEIDKVKALVTELESSNGSLGADLQQSNEKIRELQLLADEADKRIELAKSFVQEQLDAQRIENVKLQAQYDLIKAQFTAKEEQYNNLVKLSGVDESGASQILLDKKYLEAQVQSLREENVNLRRELDKSNEEKLFIRGSMKSLEERNAQLNMSVRTMSQGTAEGVSVSIPPINYQGKGMVLTVFGSGSYGVTTTAISLARALAAQASVLYIDFDMTTAKADGIFSKNPIVKNLGIPDSTKNTGLGLLFTKGATFFLENANRIIMNIEATKGGKLDYISGVYAKMNIVDVMASDYSSFINYCSNSYTYVIMDFGRIGTSDLNDRIIKTFSDIAYRDIVVTPNDKFEVNRMGQKLKENQISMANVAWLLNGCDSTILDATTKSKIQSTFCYGLMTFSSDIWGRKGDFLKTKETKTRLTKFMKDIFNGQA